ncbi:unnamed protein product, partial [Rotaria magnacalcarata]
MRLHQLIAFVFYIWRINRLVEWVGLGLGMHQFQAYPIPILALELVGS